MSNTTLPNETTQTPHVHVRLLHMNAVAERLGVSLQRAYELGRTGLLPTVRMGRQMRVEEHKLMEWIASGGATVPVDRNGARAR